MSTTTTQRQHGMLFADRLVAPLLDGRKTQTRRPLKVQPTYWADVDLQETYSELEGPSFYEPTVVGRDGEERPGKEIFGVYSKDGEWGTACPYRVGDLIWARETWSPSISHCCAPGVCDCADVNVHYPADGQDIFFADQIIPAEWTFPEKFKAGNNIPSIHMPKWACRCWLEITDVRVERIQDISKADVIAEGYGGLEDVHAGWHQPFAQSWGSIYPGSWERNDWVWALTFRRVDAPST